MGCAIECCAQKETLCPDSLRWDADSVYCYFSHPMPEFVPIKLIDSGRNYSVMNFLVYRDGDVTPMIVMLRGIEVKYRGDTMAVYQSMQDTGDPFSSISKKDSISWIWFEERGRVRLECLGVDYDTLITTYIQFVYIDELLKVEYHDFQGREIHYPQLGVLYVKTSYYLRGVTREKQINY